MIILKYSKIGHNLLRVLNPLTGLYGAIDAETGILAIRPKYTELHEFEGDRAVVVKNGRFYEVDRIGNEFCDRESYLSKLDNLDIYINPKADNCPCCSNRGCEFCMGLGMIPLNYGFDDID